MKISDLFRKNRTQARLPVFDGVTELRSESGFPIKGKKALGLDIFLELLISVLSGWSFVHVFTSAFDLTVQELVFLPAVILLSAIVLLIARDKKIGVFLFIAAIAGAVVFAVLRLQDLVAECTGIYDRLIVSFNEAYHTSTNVHYNVNPDRDVTFIMIVFSVLPVWQTGYSYGRNIPPFIATGFLLIPPILAAVCLRAPALIPLFILVLCIVSQFILCRSECLSETHEMSRNLQLKLRFLLAAFCGALVLFLVLLSAGVIFPGIRKPFERTSAVYQRSSISDLLAKIDGNPFDISKPGMSSGDFSNVGSVVRNDETILTIQFDQNSTRPLYLRGFAGDRYTGTSWESISEEAPTSSMPDEIHFSDLYSGRVDKADPFFRNPLLYVPSLYAAGFAHDASEMNILTIREIDDRDPYLYLPYYISGGDSQQLEDAVMVSDLYAEIEEKQRTVFPVKGYRSLHEALSNAVSRTYLTGGTQPSGAPLVGYEDLPTMLDLLQNRYNISATSEELLENRYTEFVFTDSDGREIHMRVKEDFVTPYEDATIQKNLESGATARVSDLAAELAQEFSIDPGAMEYEKAVSAVQKYLWNHKEYSLNPGPTDPSADFVEDFLFTKTEGYCVHFASAGTVLLRELGIPCRYVEGYLVSPAMGGSTVEITDRDAHAWTEVYIRGFGWYPVEMTISSEEEQDYESSFTVSQTESTEPETSISEVESQVEESSASDLETGSGEVTDPSQVPGQSMEQPGGETQEAPGNEPFELPKWFWPLVLSILLAGALIGGFLWLRYHIVPLEKLKKENNKATCLHLYERIRRQAGTKAFSFGVDSSPERLQKLYPELDPKRLQTLQRIAKKAYYSKEDQESEDVRTLYRMYSERLLMRKFIRRKPSPRSGSADHT